MELILSGSVIEVILTQSLNSWAGMDRTDVKYWNSSKEV